MKFDGFRGIVVFHLYLLHAGQRLRWYALASGRALLRHWQWLLVAGLVVPGIPVVPLLELPSQLLVTMVSPALDWPSRLAALMAVQLVALAWVAPQRGSIAGGDLAGYATTLPIPHLNRRLVDLTLLLAADFLPLFAFGFALAGQAGSSTDGATGVVALLVLLATILTTQLFALNLQASSLVAVAAADTVLTLGLTSAAGVLVWPALTLAMATAVVGAFASSPARGAFRSRRSRPAAPQSRAAWLPPSLHIQWRALAAQPGGSALRLATAVVVALAADRLIAALQFDGRSLPLAIIAMAIIALVLSGTYRLLRDAHASMQILLATLPLPGSYWPIRDTALVMLLGSPPLLLIVGWLGFNEPATSITLIALAVAALALLAVLRFPQAWGGRLATLLGVLIASGWAGTAIAAVAR